MLGAVGKEPVDHHADNGEEEDDQAPEELVDRRAVGLEDLDYGAVSVHKFHVTS